VQSGEEQEDLASLQLHITPAKEPRMEPTGVVASDDARAEHSNLNGTGDPPSGSTTEGDKKEEGGDKWQFANKPRRLAPQHVISKQDLGVDSPRNRALQQTQEGKKKGKPLSLDEGVFPRQKIFFLPLPSLPISTPRTLSFSYHSIQ